MTPVTLIPVRMSSTPSACQAIDHEGRGDELLEAEFRVLVEIATVGDQARQDFIDLVV